MDIKKISLLAIILFSSLLSYAQEINIIVKAPEQVSVEDEFTVRFIVQGSRNAKPTKDPLEIKGFETILGSPTISTSISTYIVGGKETVEESIIFVYIFKATKKGKYKIPRTEFVINDDKFKSDEFEIEVKSDKDWKFDKKIKEEEAFIKTIVSKDKVNLGDTLTVTYRLYTTMDIRQIKDIYHPRTNDFYASIMPIYVDGFSTETVGEKEYNVIDIRKVILQPRMLGEKKYPKGEAIIEFLIPTGRKQKDIQGYSYDEVILDTKKVLMDEVSITVLNMVGL